MKAISECIYSRGKHGIKYVRRRIPAAIRSAYPARQTHILRSLGTTDLREAKERARAELARIDAEFRLKGQRRDLSRASFATKRISKLSDAQLQGIARFWVREVLLSDERHRQKSMDDVEFNSVSNWPASGRNWDACSRRARALAASQRCTDSSISAG